jgi:peptidoglycan/xylan/chitin deacetylase (PgdA/CDA1 family)
MVVGIVMIPISLAPFVLYFRDTAEGRLLWTRATVRFGPPHRPTVRAAAVGGTDAGPDGVAVLVYHGIGSTTDAEGRFSLSVSRFADQLATMRAAGMTFVTARQVATWRRRGQSPPRNSVMITFDDGRAEAMLLADPLLRQARARATMFVIGDALDDPGIFYASRDDLEAYARTGRWDLESHTAGLHGVQDTNLGALPRLTSRAPGETLAGYVRRVDRDLDREDALLRSITGHRPVAFAYPFGAYGADRSNDVTLRRALALVLAGHYGLAFQQDDQATVPLARCADPQFEVRRLDVRPWSGRALLARIARMRADTAAWPPCPPPVHV